MIAYREEARGVCVCVCVCVCVLRQTRVGRTNTESNGSAHLAMYSL